MVAVIQNVEEIQTVIMNCSSNEEAKTMGIEGRKVVADFEKKRAEYLKTYEQKLQ